MVALLSWVSPVRGKHRKRVEIKEEVFLHLRTCRVQLLQTPRTPEIILQQRVLSAARKLRKSGITRAVLPEIFSYQEQLAKYGVYPPSTLPLRQCLALELVRAALDKNHRSNSNARIAISGDKMSGQLVKIVTELSLCYRYVLLSVPYGGEELCRQLRHEYGVTLLLDPSQDQMDSADVLLLFDPLPDPKNSVVLPLYEGAEMELPPLLLPPILEEQLPKDLDRPQLLSVLYESGLLRSNQIAVGHENKN